MGKNSTKAAKRVDPPRAKSSYGMQARRAHLGFEANQQQVCNAFGLSAKRAHLGFEEVEKGINAGEAMAEAKRCLQCKAPRCVEGCPVRVDIPRFMKSIADGKFQQAAEKIMECNPFPSICGRLCHQEERCEGMCVLAQRGAAVKIGLLERFAGDAADAGFSRERKKNRNPALHGKRPAAKAAGVVERAESGRHAAALPRIHRRAEARCVLRCGGVKKICVIGSGPAGMSSALRLAEKGFQVDVVEAEDDFGGVARYGVPRFRLPEKFVDSAVERLHAAGIRLVPQTIVGSDIAIAELRKRYDAVFIATGAWVPRRLGIKGEGLEGVVAANEFLSKVSRNGHRPVEDAKKALGLGESVVVIGGGNVAMDAARSALRFGCDVLVACRECEEEMPARKDEVRNAKAEGVGFAHLLAPKEFKANGNSMRVGGIVFSSVGGNGNVIVGADAVVLAIGQSPSNLILSSGELETNGNNRIKVDGHLQTSMQGVFAGGDAVSGSATVVEAIAAGRKAAKEIAEFLKKSASAKK